MAVSTLSRAFTKPATFRGKEVEGTISYKYSVTGVEEVFAHMYDEIHESYIKISREEIEKNLGTDEDSYSLVVDGRKDVPLEVASLYGSGIIAGRIGNTDDLKKAFEAVMRYLRGVIPGSFKKTTHYYQTSAFTSSFFTIKVNGVEVDSVNWDKVTASSNIQIYSKARYASPVESMFKGKFLLHARKIASNFENVNASFTYRNPQKMGQIAQNAGASYAFPPLAVPVLEIGTIISNVTNYIGNIEFNLERGRKRQRKNLVDRGILPEKRRIDKRNRRTPPGVKRRR